MCHLNVQSQCIGYLQHSEPGFLQITNKNVIPRWLYSYPCEPVLSTCSSYFELRYAIGTHLLIWSFFFCGGHKKTLTFGGGNVIILA